MLISSNRRDDLMEVTDLAVRDVADLLHPQYAIVTGGKSRDGCPIITFPDLGNFCSLGDAEYQRLVQYLTSVPSMQEADSGFVLVIDRRNDKWNSVKTVLLKVSGFFPGLIHVVYVLRPAGFIQKAISEVSNKLFKEEFKFRVVVCNCVEELHDNVEKSQLTADLGGEIPYCHQEWIQQRVALEKFSCNMQEVSAALDSFTQSLQDAEFPNDVDATQQLLNSQGIEYSELKEEILNAAKHGEDLLKSIRQHPATGNTNGSTCATREDQLALYRVCPYRLGNVTAVERLLVQLEETERTFDDYWFSHSARLRQCLELRRFEQDFKELQSNFDCHLKSVCEMTEVGETVARVDTLIKEATALQKLCMTDVERAEELISVGQQLLHSRHYCALDCVQPKCSELQRMCQLLPERLESRLSTLGKCRDLQERIDKANRWCTRGIDLLASQHIEKCSTSPDLAEQSLLEIQQYVTSAEEFKLSSPKEFRSLFQDSITSETKALVTQVLQRIDDVSMMCEKRMTNLKRLTLKLPRPVQTVTPEPAVPLQQPPCCAPDHVHNHHSKTSNKVFRKANTLPKIEVPSDMWNAQAIKTDTCDTAASSPDSETSTQDLEVLKTKRGHVLAELLETERVYVSELGSLIKGYKCELQSSEMQSLIPPALVGKADVLFGNLEEIFNFHSKVFLRDLENCISNTELVALCFTQRRDAFLRLYSYYCQNSPRSERLRETVGEKNMFFQACQLKLGHKLPLAAYLLKPVQRLTKYQLLLKDLLRYTDDKKCRKELQEALDCMLIVLKCVNDSMHQIAITGFWGELSDQGELLMQGSFSVWTDSKKDRLRELRLKPMQRHIFLYQKAMLFCKKAAKEVHNKDTYHFKRYLKMSQIGLTESVKGDPRKFEVWLQGRQEVHTIQALTVQQKDAWVCEIKRVLLEQLTELKGEKIRQYSLAGTGKPIHRPLRQTSSWESHTGIPNNMTAFNADTVARHPSHPPPQHTVSENGEEEGESGAWSSDYSNSEDEDTYTEQSEAGGRFTALADYCAVGHSEVSMHEGDAVELVKVGCAGWWYIKVIGSNLEGWVPSAYLEPFGRRSLRSSQSVSSQDGGKSSVALPLA
ncbi:Guanine nucleotide exchange factor DBS [Cryptotermes secundus]|uniref:Guanine nucleotide exchange factor DBS n=1 Tax=Cryptotermes secundus TaxID=105785 RepID=A0A2J7Q864_9NEOP|nr:guanine nucleotide exchange factor DBS isoform X2 [Cryptotermes secundus]PNF24765.1 Guanine nucleotide exchange factor DBS [Cryptotermes secundus]